MRPVPGPWIHGTCGPDHHRRSVFARPDDTHLLDGVWPDMACAADRHRFDHVPPAQCARNGPRAQGIPSDATGITAVSDATAATVAATGSAAFGSGSQSA